MNKQLITLVGAFFIQLAWAQEDLSLCLRGQQAEQSGQFSQAIEFYQTCIEKGSLQKVHRIATRRNLGVNYSRLNQFDRAVEQHNFALGLSPSDPWVDYTNRGNAHSALGALDEALKDYAQALQLREHYNQAYYNRGIVFEKQGKLPEARQQFQLAHQHGLRSPDLIARMSVHGLQASEQQGLSEHQAVPSMDIFRGAIMQIANVYQGHVVCIPNGENLATVRPVLEQELQSRGVQGLPSPHQIRVAMVSRYPCPFSPLRPELRFAKVSDIEGVWQYPHASQKLRFGPQSSGWQRFRGLPPIVCESLAYYSGGEARNTQLFLDAGKPCPFTRAEDLDATRQNPRVMSWSMPTQGRIVISRTDIQGHIEEWEVFVVTQAFEFANVKFQTGDLVSYIRKERGNDINAATSFRHLQKLP
jgi:hypothetical protein